ncbi:MAG: hypothetical protein ABIF87_02985 [Pseudomonadota bacterium]
MNKGDIQGMGTIVWLQPGKGGDIVGIARSMEINGQLQQTNDVQGTAMYRGRKYARKRPMGITMLGLFMLIGGMFCICAGLSEIPAGILGMAVSGTTAVVIHFLHAGISIYIFTGFLRLKRSAWSVYMIFLALGIANNLITIISSGSFNQLTSIMLMCLFGYYVNGKKGLFVN